MEHSKKTIAADFNKGPNKVKNLVSKPLSSCGVFL